MEFESYKQCVEQSANNMIKHFIEQIGEREIFYKNLVEEKEVAYQKIMNVKDNEIALLSQTKQQLEMENSQLKETLKQYKNPTSNAHAVQDEKVNAMLSIDEEDYQQLIDDIQKAYIIESQRLVAYCLDDLVKYREGYKTYIQIDDFWSIVFVAYTCDRHCEIYEAYANLISLDKQECPENELYMKLLRLSSEGVEQANFEEAIKYIRDKSKDMVNIYPYIKNELLAEMSEVIEQMHQDFLILEENKGYQCTEQEEDIMNSAKVRGVEELNKTYDSNQEEVNTAKVKVDEQGKSLIELVKDLLDTCEEEKQTKLAEINKDKELYSIPQINNAIRKYVEGDEWEKLKGALRYVIKHYKYYQGLFDEETFYEYLLMSYMFEYDEIFCKRFASARERLTTTSVGCSIYSMIEAEKNMSLYTTQLNCASRAMDQSIPKKNIFRQMDGKKVLKRLKKIFIPHTNKVQVLETLEEVVMNPDSVWKKYKVFVKTQEAKMILIEAWRKNDTGSWFITTATYKNIKPQLAKKQIKIVPILGRIENSSQNAYNQVSIAEYTKSSSITNINQDATVSEIPLNEKSPLKVIGYDTKKSKEERWRILTQQAIPKLGKAKVVWYINFFIKMHRKKPTMASAIKEWEYDLRRLGAK